MPKNFRALLVRLPSINTDIKMMNIVTKRMSSLASKTKRSIGKERKGKE